MRHFLFLLFCLPVVLTSKVFEIKKIEELKNFLKPDTLVVFDIDNTLIEPLQILGSDQWFDSKIKFYKKQGLSRQQAFQKTYDEYYQIQSITDSRTVEKNTPKIFLQTAEKNQVMGLTTRDLCLSYATLKQLKKLNLAFNKAPLSEEVYLYTDRGLLYKDGIFFTAGAHKGRAFAAFLKKTGLKNPKSILFVNDKLKPLQEMQGECESMGIAFTGLRYGYLDKKVKSLNRRILQRKLPSLSQLIFKISSLCEKPAAIFSKNKKHPAEVALDTGAEN